MLAVVAPIAVAGSASWAHQDGSLQSNGAVTVKSLSGGSYTSTQNPSGAIAKANQNAATQPPTVIIQATGSSSYMVAATRLRYNGNLGGVAGGTAKCVIEFGTGWRFAGIGHLYALASAVGTVNAWVDDPNGQSCNSWTDSGGTTGAAINYYGTNTFFYTTTPASCFGHAPVLCANF